MRIGLAQTQTPAAAELRRLLEDVGHHSIAWVARDGADAAVRCSHDRPDLLLLDLDLPEAHGTGGDGPTLRDYPCPVLLTSKDVNADASRIMHALRAGAVDVLELPGLEQAQDGARRDFLWRLNSLASLNRSEHPGPDSALRRRRAPHPCLVAIGASAGGPEALVSILSRLPADLPAAVVIVQHLDEHFAAGFTDWLSRSSRFPVRFAREGDLPALQTVLVAGTDGHLVVLPGGRVGYRKEPAHLSYRPSIDVFYESAIEQWTGPLVGVLLTGMGRDGARGLKAMRDAGHHTIAQDRATSAVYGMPKAAAELQAATEVLPLTRIPEAIRGRCTAAPSLAPRPPTCRDA